MLTCLISMSISNYVSEFFIALNCFDNFPFQPITVSESLRSHLVPTPRNTLADMVVDMAVAVMEETREMDTEADRRRLPRPHQRAVIKPHRQNRVIYKLLNYLHVLVQLKNRYVMSLYFGKNVIFGILTTSYLEVESGFNLGLAHLALNIEVI